jgi:hypothetical protein
MVLQSELIDEIILPTLNAEAWSMEFGESVAVTYSDNTLDTTTFTDTGLVTSIENNELVATAQMLSTEGGTSDYNAILLKTADGAANKCLFTSFTKDAQTQVELITRQGFFIQ